MSTLPLDRRTLIGRMGAQLTGTVAARALSAIAIIVIARSVGPERFGAYAASMTLAKISSVAFGLGLETWMLRAGARTASDRDLATVSGNVLTIKATLGILWFAVIVGVAPLVSPTVFPLPVLALCAAIVWFEEIALVAWSTFAARLRNVTASILLIVGQALVCAFVVALALLGSETLVSFLSGRMIATALGAAISLVWLVHVWGVRVDRAQIPGTLRETAPFGASVLLSVIYGSVDVILVAQLLGTTAAGLYSPAATLVTILYLVPTAAYYVMIPVLSQLYNVNRVQLVRTAHRFLWGSIAMGIALGAALFIGADWMIGLLYGAEYAASAEVLRWLSPVLALHCVSFAFGAQLAATGRQSRRIVVQGVVCVVNIVANLILLPRFGVIGAAYAFLISEVILVAGYGLLALRWERDVRATSLHNLEQAP